MKEKQFHHFWFISLKNCSLKDFLNNEIHCYSKNIFSSFERINIFQVCIIENENIWKRLVHLFYLFILQLFLVKKKKKELSKKRLSSLYSPITLVFFLLKYIDRKSSLPEVERSSFVAFKKGFVHISAS